MKSEEILMALGDVDERYIEESAPKKKRNALKWSALAASLLLICGIAVQIFYTPSFETFLKRYEKGYYREAPFPGCLYAPVEYTLQLSLVPINNRLAQYEEKPNAKQSLLENYIGELFKESKAFVWYYIKGKDTLEYLISEDKDDGELSLWNFSGFSGGVRGQDGTLEDWFSDMLTEYFGDADVDLNLEACTFDELLSVYGLEGAHEIEKMIVKPNDARDSDTKELIWTDFEEKTLTDTKSIQTVYDMLTKTAAYGNYTESVRFSYSFSKENGGRGFPCGICELSIVLKDGTVMELIRYDATVGAFQHSGTYSALLSEEDVYTLNAIFGIE